MNPNKKKNTDVVSDEVEELLRAAEDAALLKLNLNSHTVCASPSDLHPDLEQRFRHLKSGSKSKAKPEALTKKPPPAQPANVKEDAEGDYLFMRFAALKASLPKPSPSTVSSSLVDIDAPNTSLKNVSKLADGRLVGKVNIDNEEEDEVEKVIRWAMDAARLDPSPPSDDEDSTQNEDYGNDETSDEDARSPQRNRKGKCK